MWVVAFANQKGGVGKTTTAVNVAAAAAQSGQRVLLVDGDPQGNAGMHLLGPAIGDLSETLYQVLLGKTSAASVIQAIPEVPNLFLLPSNLDLAGAEVELLSALGRERVLADVLKPLVETYDLVIIDTPPSLGLLTLNALAASRYVVVPVQTHFFALAGLSMLSSLVERICERVNPQLRILGLVPTFYADREVLTREVMEKLHDAFGDLVTRTVIHRNTDTARAAGWAQAIVTSGPRTIGGQDYLALTKELLQRMQEGEIRE